MCQLTPLTMWCICVDILNKATLYEDMIDHHSYAHNLGSREIKAWKNSGPNGIRTHDLCDTGAVL